MSRRRYFSRPFLGAAFLGASLLTGGIMGASGCSSDEAPAAEDCDAGDVAFVRHAMLALNGRHLYSAAEGRVWTTLLAQLSSRDVPRDEARRYVARMMMENAESFRDRWGVFLMDALQVVRARFFRDASWELVQAASCYGDPAGTGVLVDPQDGGALAAWVRDHGPDAEDPPLSGFTLGRLLGSSLELDDLTPIYRAQLFHMLQYPLSGANVDALDLEAARRRDLAKTFEAAFTNRDTVCLECHNSKTSVTDNDEDPSLDRTWPVGGLLELSVFGSNKAEEPPAVYDAVFRIDGVKTNFASEGEGPWGWDRSRCGAFVKPAEGDPLGVDARFASVGGTSASVWDLEQSLRSGFDELRGEGLKVDEEGVPSSPDAAFAYLVSMNIVGQVWKEVMGSPLTIAHAFPRNRDQRDTLRTLTDAFVESGFSLKTLLAEIATHPTFNVRSPAESCGATPYHLDPVLNPWSVDNQDDELRANSAGDALHHLPGRLVQSALYAALEWGKPQVFPQSDEAEEFMSSLGFFIESSKPGFRGFGFQSKLSLEEAYGQCLGPVSNDFIDRLVLSARQTEGATLRDVVVALKDRLVDEPFVVEAETKALESLLDSSLSTPAADVTASDLELGARLVCGAYVMSPQFLLEGVASTEVSEEIPRLTPADHDFASSCERLTALAEEAELPYLINCLVDDLTVSKR